MQQDIIGFRFWNLFVATTNPENAVDVSGCTNNTIFCLKTMTSRTERCYYDYGIRQLHFDIPHRLRIASAAKEDAQAAYKNTKNTAENVIFIASGCSSESCRYSRGSTKAMCRGSANRWRRCPARNERSSHPKITSTIRARSVAAAWLFVPAYLVGVPESSSPQRHPRYPFRSRSHHPTDSPPFHHEMPCEFQCSSSRRLQCEGLLLQGVF